MRREHALEIGISEIDDPIRCSATLIHRYGSPQMISEIKLLVAAWRASLEHRYWERTNFQNAQLSCA
jgi:hypothetical protein